MSAAYKYENEKPRPRFMKEQRVYNFLGLTYLTAREIISILLIALVVVVLLWAGAWVFAAFCYAMEWSKY